MTTTQDRAFAVLSDPDRDAVYVVDIARRALARTVKLAAGDQPGRVVVDGAGRAHVVLRRAGEVATFHLVDGTLERREVCPEPRGIAHDAATDSLVVVCEGGEIVTMGAAGGEPVVVRSRARPA